MNRLRQAWTKWSGRIDALTLRERALVFAAAAASIVFASYYVFLDPLLSKQSLLRAQIAQQRNHLAGIEADITHKAHAGSLDPDRANRARLDQLAASIAGQDGKLRAMQKGLVAPERVAPLLETILKANGRLRLVSMNTLPVSSLSGGGFAPAAVAAPAPAPAAVPAPDAAELLYRHGVQVAVRGNYLDMIDYMSALEAMPAQLFWGEAQLEVEQYPNAQLTLTLYTLSLERKWMKL